MRQRKDAARREADEKLATGLTKAVERLVEFVDSDDDRVGAEGGPIVYSYERAREQVLAKILAVKARQENAGASGESAAGGSAACAAY